MEIDVLCCSYSFEIRPDGKTIGNYVHEQSWSVGDMFPAAGLDAPA